jgi:dihydrodipicolinate synthase/N-acetylneuraminate lyase
MTDWSGVGTALVTPFTTAGAVDDRALGALVDRQVRGGVHFVVPCGTTGERHRRSRGPSGSAVVRITVEVCAGKNPVLAGGGGYDTAEVAELAHATEALGVQGLLSVTPYLQQAHAGRPVPALPCDCRQDVAADHRLQRARPSPAAMSSRARWRAWPRSPTS